MDAIADRAHNFIVGNPPRCFADVGHPDLPPETASLPRSCAQRRALSPAPTLTKSVTETLMPGDPNRLPPDRLNLDTPAFGPIAEGWRTVDCAEESKPLAVGGGFPTAGGGRINPGIGILRMAQIEERGMLRLDGAAHLGRSVDPLKIPKVGSAGGGSGGWWEAWYLQKQPG